MWIVKINCHNHCCRELLHQPSKIVIITKLSMGKMGFTSRACIARVTSFLCHKFNTFNKDGLRLQRQLRRGPWSKARGTNSSSVSAVPLTCCQHKALAHSQLWCFPYSLRDFGSLQCMVCSVKPHPGDEWWPWTPGSCCYRLGAKWERADAAKSWNPWACVAELGMNP